MNNSILTVCTANVTCIHNAFTHLHFLKITAHEYSLKLNEGGRGRRHASLIKLNEAY